MASIQQTFSIGEQFRGKIVLLTGATGYVGGLVLECLLRTTGVDKVYVLLRPKNDSTAADRLGQYLQKNIFHQVRNQQQLLGKVVAVNGDITQPGLGLDPSIKQTLLQEVQIILHCAADIRLEVDIHSALTSNYCGTEAVLQLVAQCKQLKALVHTSSCFVNMNQPRSTVVREQLYPLMFGTNEIDCEELVKDLLCLPSAAADTRASALGLRWGFPNNYTFSKHLAEQLVGKYHQRGLPAAIVRPSLVCSVAYEPIPGYIGNWAGPIGASAALAIGFYHSLGCVSSQPLHVWDCMPADLVANAVLATAAAVAAGAGTSIAARAAGATAAAGGHSSPLITATTTTPNSSSSSLILIVHSSSSSTYPMTLMEGWNYAVEFMQMHKPKFRLSWARLPPMTPTFQPDPAVVNRERWWTALKVKVACLLLRLFGWQRAAARLQSGFEALCVYGTSKTDKDLVFSANTLHLLEQQLIPAEQQKYRLVMRPGMPLPAASPAVGANRRSSTSSSCKDGGVTTDVSNTHRASQVHLLHTAAADPLQKQVLTWRRYFHSQLAAVYSLLFRVSVPRSAAGSVNGASIEHDFQYVR